MRIKAAVLVCSIFLLVLVTPLRAQQKKPSENAPHDVAVVGGEHITEADLQAVVGPQLRPLRDQEYQIKRRALDRLVDEKLIAAEAKRRGISVAELLRVEADSKVTEPTEDEIRVVHETQQSNVPLEQVHAQIAQALKQAKARVARQKFLDQLHSQGNVNILLDPPRTEVSVDPARVRGNPQAAVVIIEFSDFQCPYCRNIEPMLRQLLTKYEGKVKLAFRDLPLTDIHPLAQNAARAARCAGESGKFWEYHDLLFSNDRLDNDSLIGYAEKVGIAKDKFSACIGGDKYDAEVKSDRREGMAAGVTGTPGFFIDGLYVEGGSPMSAFEKIIDQELARSN